MESNSETVFISSSHVPEEVFSVASSPHTGISSNSRLQVKFCKVLKPCGPQCNPWGGWWVWKRPVRKCSQGEHPGVGVPPKGRGVPGDLHGVLKSCASVHVNHRPFSSLQSSLHCRDCSELIAWRDPSKRPDLSILPLHQLPLSLMEDTNVWKSKPPQKP